MYSRLSPYFRARPVVVAAAGLSLLLTMSGCAYKMEQRPIDVYPVATTIGTGWHYRGPERETIQTGQAETSNTLRSDAAFVQRQWIGKQPRLMFGEDGAGEYALLAFDDQGTGRMNPLRGGIYSWDVAGMKTHIKQTMRVLNSETPKYSLHLLATEDDARPGMSAAVVAQIRLRRIADAFMDEGLDPRLITGQVLPVNNATNWTFAIALRPYIYGSEQSSHQLIAPWSLHQIGNGY